MAFTLSRDTKHRNDKKPRRWSDCILSCLAIPSDDPLPMRKEEEKKGNSRDGYIRIILEGMNFLIFYMTKANTISFELKSRKAISYTECNSVIDEKLIARKNRLLLKIVFSNGCGMVFLDLLVNTENPLFEELKTHLSFEESTTSGLPPKYKSVLYKHYDDLLKCCDVESVITYLFQKNIISYDQREKQRTYKTSVEKMDALLEQIILPGSVHNFAVLLSSLMDTDPGVSEKIIDNICGHNERPVSRNAKQEREDHWLEEEQIYLDEGMTNYKTRDIKEATFNEETLEKVCDELSSTPGWPNEFEGMYVRKHRIIVDRYRDNDDKLSVFLFVKCREIFTQAGIKDPKQIIQFIDQEEKAEYMGNGNDGQSNEYKSKPHEEIASTKGTGLLAVKTEDDTCISAESVREGIYTLADELCLQPNWPKEVVGLIIKQETIVVDYFGGAEDTLNYFFNNTCRSIFNKYGIEPGRVLQYSTQSTDSDYYVRRGEAICRIPSHLTVSSIFEQSASGKTVNQLLKDNNISYGTVACIGKGLDEKRYLITAHHVFETEPNSLGDTGDTKELSIFCENEEKLDHVGNMCHGILGGNGPNRKGVDISVVPIKPSAKESKATGTHLHPKIFMGDVKELANRQVERLGSTVAFAYGIVCETNYRPRIGDGPCSECLLVVADPEHKTDTFAQGGDSGSLVISRNGQEIEAIGIISKGIKSWQNSNSKRVPAAIVVLLKNCFEAINSKFDIQLDLDGKWESFQAIALTA